MEDIDSLLYAARELQALDESSNFNESSSRDPKCSITVIPTKSTFKPKNDILNFMCGKEFLDT